ncbi:MAG: glycosyltransferase family 9 protein [Gemmatimonadota bacterium]
MTGAGGIGRILLVQPRWMGDVLLCTPAIREARRAFAHATIDFATEPAGGEILARNPYLDDVLVDEGSWRSRARLLRRVARAGYDAVVDFRSTGSTAQLALVSRARIRVGLRGRGPRNLAYTTLVARQTLDTYAARHKLNMLSALGVDVRGVTDLSLTLPIGEPARRRAAAIWREHGLEGERVVAISPVSRERFKQWGAERWAAAADRIATEGVRVLLTHGPGEADQVRAVAQAMRIAAVWDYGSTSIEELAALLERCVLWTGNDGGAKHVAAAAGIPTLTVVRWQIGPVWTDAAAPARQTFIDRAPPGGCDLRCPQCSHLNCLGAIRTDDVVDRIRQALTAAG